MNMNDRLMADPPVPHRDGYAQGTLVIWFIAWASAVALGAWLAWG